MAALEDGTCFGLPSRHDVALAERISERVPVVERLRFTNSGSEAVMMAFRTARALTGKDGILRFEGSYHGIYDAALPAGAAGIPADIYGTSTTRRSPTSRPSCGRWTSTATSWRA